MVFTTYSFKKFEGEVRFFVEQILDEVSEYDVIQPWYCIDHICFRVNSQQAYQFYKENFCEFADLMVESEVNGRNISTLKLRHPIWVGNFRIDLLELPEPKPGSKYDLGFEHIEVVYPRSLKELVSVLPTEKLGRKGLQKDFNPELALKLSKGVIKFHSQSLESVVRLEKNQRVFEALNFCEILSQFRELEPLVVGTFPLGLEVSTSDVDIVLQVSDLQEFISQAEQFSHHEGFQIEKKQKWGRDTVLMRFCISEIPFEVFAQSTSSHLQRSYRHFLIEERALRFLSEDQKLQINQWREQGQKTEPVFAKILKLPGPDPFESLLELENWSDLKWSEYIQNLK